MSPTPSLFMGYRGQTWAVPSSCSRLYFGTSEFPKFVNSGIVSIIAEHSKPFHFLLTRDVIVPGSEPGAIPWVLSTWDLRKPSTLAAEGDHWVSRRHQPIELRYEERGRLHNHSASLIKGAYTLHFLGNAERADFFVPNADAVLESGGRVFVASKNNSQLDPADDRAVPIYIGNLIEVLDDFVEFMRAAAEPGTPAEVDEHNAAVLDKYYRKAVECEQYRIRSVLWPDSRLEDPNLEIEFLFNPTTGKIGAFKNQRYAERAAHLAWGRITVPGNHHYLARVDFDSLALMGDALTALTVVESLNRLPILISQLGQRQLRLKP